MPQLIKDDALADDPWTLFESAPEAPPAGHAIVPLEYWVDHAETLDPKGPWGVWVDGDADAEAVAERLAGVALVAVRFPAFSDGRGLSLGTLLRTRHHFTGELRAFGDMLPDLASYLERSGFDAIVFDDARTAQVALAVKNSMSDVYQASVREPIPPFRRAQRS